ncbi:MAG: hypothetical protein AAF108_06035 [Planctomycetota bacterium]
MNFSSELGGVVALTIGAFGASMAGAQSFEAPAYNGNLSVNIGGAADGDSTNDLFNNPLDASFEAAILDTFTSIVASSSASGSSISSTVTWNGVPGSVSNPTYSSSGAGLVSVTENALVRFSWDLSLLSASDIGGVSVFDTSSGSQLFSTTFGSSNLVGSVDFDLVSGVNYVLSANAGGTFTEGGTAFYAFEIIPAPATAGLFAAAGFVGVRRRR